MLKGLTPKIIVGLCWLLMSCGIDSKHWFHRANVYDHTIFSQQEMNCKNDAPFYFYFSPITIRNVLQEWQKKISTKKYNNIEHFFTKTKTIAFIVIRNDSVLYENYFNNMSRDSLVGVFSVSKSLVGLVTGIAINQKKISLDEPVYKYIPEYKNDSRKKIQIQHLLHMTSGFNISDNVNLGKIIKLYYTDNLDLMMRQISMKFAPGSNFTYKSFDTQVLGYCIEKATNDNMPHLVEKYILEPLQMEYNASWNTDRYMGRAKMFGGLNIRPIDLCKIGSMMLHNGNFKNKNIIPASWVENITSRNACNDCSWKYAYGWWHTVSTDENKAKKSKAYFAAGLRGQILYIDPDKNLIILRQGTDKGNIHWDYNMYSLAEML